MRSGTHLSWSCFEDHNPNLFVLTRQSAEARYFGIAFELVYHTRLFGEQAGVFKHSRYVIAKMEQ